MSDPSNPSIAHLAGARPPATDWSSDELARALAAASEWAVGYRERVAEFPVLPHVVPGETRALLAQSPPREPESFESVLADFDQIVVPRLTHWNHPGFLAYFSSAARGPSVVAELLIAAVGVNAMLWRTSPAATELELVVTDWLRQAVGLPPCFRGVILDTASSSSFAAMLAARERAGENVRVDGVGGAGTVPLTTYVSDQAHSSIQKAAIAAGLGLASVRRIASGPRFRMDVHALDRALAEDVASGAHPMLIAATLGTTSTASMDPVGAIADIAEEYDTWLHVDAAYAGSAAMVPEAREPFRGWERADSIVINPHKWLGTSLDCSVLLFRDPDPFREALSLMPEYLKPEPGDGTNLMEFGLPLGRRFRALKLWVLFRCVGTHGLIDMLRNHMAMAADFAARIEADDRFELAAPVQFSTVCFRVRTGPGHEAPDEDTLNRRVLGRVNRMGRVFLSHTELDRRYTIRLSIGSVYTRGDDIDAALLSLGEAADAELAGVRRSR